MSLAESSVTATARLLQEELWVGMWKDLYCFALRINMVLPDWRGIIGLGLYFLVLGPIDLKLAAQPHILKGTSSRELHHSVVLLKRVSITFAWLLCARRESP